MQRACWSAFPEWQQPLPRRSLAGKPTLFRRGFVMADELMLFLALVAAFIVVLAEWWARRTP